MAQINLPPPETFIVEGESSLAQRWGKWIKRVELFMTASNITEAAQKRAILLHLAGPEVQEIFETLTDTGNDYETAKLKLKGYFEPKCNVTYERHIFRNTTPLAQETVASFVTRLRQIAENCNFEASKDDMIRDQVVEKCTLKGLRKRLLQEENLTLEKVLNISRTIETAESQAKEIESHRDSSGAGNSVDYVGARPKSGQPKYQNRPNNFNKQSVAQHHENHNKPKQGKNYSHRQFQGTCRTCGQRGHMSKNCFVRHNKACFKCGENGHFARVCKSKKPGHVSTVSENNVSPNVDYDDDSDNDYVFTVNPEQGNIMVASVNGKTFPILVDSGASQNIMSLKTFKSLNVAKKLQDTDVKVYTYGSTEHLPLAGEINIDITLGGVESNLYFIVTKADAISVLSSKTSKKLGFLKVNVNQVTEQSSEWDSISNKYPSVFTGLGKLNDRTIKLHIDESVTPRAQPVRRVPFSVRGQLEEKLQELEQLDVIEKVTDGATPWVSPLVVAFKPSGDIRVCVDMRQANQAILRERHPIPTVDEVLQEMNGAQYFTKLDLNSAFHQLELDEQSRYITTFVAPSGLYRYRRLMFGVNSAPEICQNTINQIISDCVNTKNIADDIIVWGNNKASHDKNVECTIQKLMGKGLTLNKEKCQFGMTQIEFMGHLLSKHGIGPTETRIQSIVDARAPNNASEVRSFLGMVQFCARYLPDLATVSEPLRYLTRSRTQFKWGKIEQDAFKAIKDLMCKSETLAYFDPKRKTKVVVDASPVGLGAILLQAQDDGFYRPVYFASRALTDVEKRYSQTEKEALGVVWGCEKFHIYLYGLPHFELVTDHKALETIYSPKSKPSLRIERWSLRLLPYSFKVVYQPGKYNIADCLSRLSVKSSTNVKFDKQAEYAYLICQRSVPSALTGKIIEQASANDAEISALWKVIKSGNKGRVARDYKNVFDELTCVGKIVMRGSRIVIPGSLRKQTLDLAHRGHQGIVRVKGRLREKVWWPGIDREVEHLVQCCHLCQINSAKPKPEPMTRNPMPEKAWSKISIDLCGPFPTGEQLFVICDYFSRWPEVKILHSVTSSAIINALSEVFSTHGYPDTIVSDNGPQFVSKEFKAYMQEIGVNHERVTPYWPAANGVVERFNQTMLKPLRAANASGQNWKKEINDFLMDYRSTPHTQTGLSPAELLMGRKIKTKLPHPNEQSENENVVECARERDLKKKEEGKRYGDSRRGATESDIKAGDKVLLQQSKVNKLTTTYEHEPYIVAEKNNNSLTLLAADGRKIRRNSAHVRKYFEDCDQSLRDTKNDSDLSWYEVETPATDIVNVQPEPVARPVNTQPEPVARPRRENAGKPPTYLNDFVVNKSHNTVEPSD